LVARSKYSVPDTTQPTDITGNPHRSSDAPKGSGARIPCRAQAALTVRCYNETTAIAHTPHRNTAMSRPVTVSIPHSLGKDEARRRIEQGFGQLRNQMAGGATGLLGKTLTFQERWEGDRLHFEGSGLGQKMTGRLDIRDNAVDIQLDLPEILAAIADRITGKLKAEGQKLLEKK
jgi:Putative polyhydroxyalkanoic acid system protein (PHA_gran_rgn)